MDLILVDDFSPVTKVWAEIAAREAMEPTYFQRFSKPQPERRGRHWRRRTWRLREALRGLRLGWRGDLE